MMALTVEVLGSDPLPTVRVIITGVPAGQSWILTGATVDGTWKVAQGVGDGRDVILADPWAPLGLEATYEARHGTTVDSAGPVTRPYLGQDAVTSLDGRRVVDFLWDRSGGDPRERVPRAEWFEGTGFLAPGTFAPTAGAGTGSLKARTVRPATDTMRELVRANRPVILLHNTERCRIPGCDVDPVRTVFLTGAPEDRTARLDRAERMWSLSYRLAPKPHGWLPPVTTVVDLMRYFPTVQDLVDSGLTVDDLRRGDWAFSGMLQTTQGFVPAGGGDLTMVAEGEYVDGPVGTLVESDEYPGEYVIQEGAS